MALSDEARNRIFIAHTDRTIGDEISDAIDHGKEAVAPFHDVTGAGLFASKGPGQQAPPVHYGATLGFVYTPNTHEGYRTFKISSKYYGNPTFHVHWTKSTDANEQGKAVRWRISYTLTNGRDQDVNITPEVLEFEDTYDDDGTTTRIVHRTEPKTPVGFAPESYLSMKIEAITPVGTPLTADPVLVSCDLRYDMYINK